MNDIYFGTTGPRDARCILVGEAWGEEEERRGQAFVGASGQELNNMLAEAGIARDEILCTNILPRRPGCIVPGAKANDFWQLFYDLREQKRHTSYKSLYPHECVLQGIDRLYSLIDQVEPDLVIGCGNYPAWALSDGWNLGKAQVPKGVPGRLAPTGITLWRGSQLYTNLPEIKIPFVPLIHPAAILNNWSFRARTVHDLKTRIRPILRGEKWVEPQYEFHINLNFKTTCEILDFLFEQVNELTLDIENSGGYIDIIGLGWSPTSAACILFINPDGSPRYSLEEESTIRSKIRRLLDSSKKIIIQNAIHDVPMLEGELIWPPGRLVDWDTMVAQHTFFPGSPKSLEYLASMFCSFYKYWKEESEDWHPSMDIDAEQLYNCKDCAATFEIFLEQRELMHKLSYKEQIKEKMEELNLSIDMTRAGFPFDISELQKQRTSVLNQLHQYEYFLHSILPSSLLQQIRSKASKAPWYSSPIQQMKLFYDVLCFPEIKTRATKRQASHRTIDDDALRKLEAMEPVLSPITKALRDYRSLGNYYSNHLSLEAEPDGRLRSSFGLHPINFRWNSKTNVYGRGGNLQNTPKGKDKG